MENRRLSENDLKPIDDCFGKKKKQKLIFKIN
jgi:hypothetical protein